MSSAEAAVSSMEVDEEIVIAPSDNKKVVLTIQGKKREH